MCIKFFYLRANSRLGAVLVCTSRLTAVHDCTNGNLCLIVSCLSSRLLIYNSSIYIYIYIYHRGVEVLQHIHCQCMMNISTCIFLVFVIFLLLLRVNCCRLVYFSLYRSLDFLEVSNTNMVSISILSFQNS